MLASGHWIVLDLGYCKRKVLEPYQSVQNQYCTSTVVTDPPGDSYENNGVLESIAPNGEGGSARRCLQHQWAVSRLAPGSTCPPLDDLEACFALWLKINAKR
ncbi:hypothetical protein DEO72_LG8g1604 [Vigna unguiculata]|uniref:Uncharacterized protein n=1 Tax=Vigna unguiculata TaxID=3917 RepID=A0A4D6MTZ5_VIGUN|nr:hypothetical protein DEO72_LG8g1604 [Vigna unguiculata]